MGPQELTKGNAQLSRQSDILSTYMKLLFNKENT